MTTDDVKRLATPLDRLLYFIAERWMINYQRFNLGKPFPWTIDEIFQTYKFCNIRRMDDKVSQWLFNHWYVPNFDHSNILIAVSLARFINLPSTLEMIGFPHEWRPAQIKEMVRGISKDGRVVFGQSYMIRGTDGTDKIDSTVDWYVGGIADNPPTVYTNSMRRTWAELVTNFGFGAFMAGQVVADLRWAMTGEWRDKVDWAPCCPMSSRGMNRLLGRPPKTKLHVLEFEEGLFKVIEKVKANLPERVWSRLEAMDYQHILQEYDKYESILWGDGNERYPLRVSTRKYAK